MSHRQEQDIKEDSPLINKDKADEYIASVKHGY